MPTRLTPFTLRLDYEFLDRIIELADEEDRSINMQMTRLLKLGYEQYMLNKTGAKPKSNRPKTKPTAK